MALGTGGPLASLVRAGRVVTQRVLLLCLERERWELFLRNLLLPDLGCLVPVSGGKREAGATASWKI